MNLINTRFLCSYSDKINYFNGFHLKNYISKKCTVSDDINLTFIGQNNYKESYYKMIEN